MRQALFCLAFVFVAQIVTPYVVHAERIKQWIAPLECVIDYGLPTQVILSEQDCYNLLHPQPPEPPVTVVQPPAGLVSQPAKKQHTKRSATVTGIDQFDGGDLSFNSTITNGPISFLVADNAERTRPLESALLLLMLCIYAGLSIYAYRRLTRFVGYE